MKIWNYRIIHIDNLESLGHDPFFSIYEVYYNEDGTICNWSESPASPFGDDLKELRADSMLIMEAFYKPVLSIVNEKLIEHKDEPKED